MRRAAVKRLKTLRHPSVLTFLAECDSPTSVLLATELVTPLSEHLGEIVDRGPKREYYLAWGIFQVCRALAFLNNDAKLKHNNLNSASVFVTRAGDWKLAGLEYVCAADVQAPAKILPCLEKYTDDKGWSIDDGFNCNVMYSTCCSIIHYLTRPLTKY